MLAFLALDHVEAVCQSAYTKANCPSEIAVFYRHESEGRLHFNPQPRFSQVSEYILFLKAAQFWKLPKS